MPRAQEIYDLMEARRLELGLSQADVGARAFGKQDNSAFQALRRGSSPSADKLEALCKALDLEFYFGPQRDRGLVDVIPADDRDYAHIPLHDAALAAGGGRENGTEAIIDFLAFRRDWLRRIGVSPSDAVLARAEGDSMQPTIWHGDIVMIDRARTLVPLRRTDPKPGTRSPVYALLEDGKARLKRIERPEPGLAMLLSDNPDYGPQITKTETLSIIGKVVWWGHTNRD